jgi:hypothetical protein
MLQVQASWSLKHPLRRMCLRIYGVLLPAILLATLKMKFRIPVVFVTDINLQLREKDVESQSASKFSKQQI